MGWTAQIDAILLARETSRVRRVAIALVTFTFLLDAAGVVILREAPNLLGLKVRIDWSVGGLGER